MSRKRVVVTGLSALTPLGGNVTESWDNLLAGKSGIGPITLYDTADMKVKLAAEAHGFAPEDFIDKREARKMDRFTQFAGEVKGFNPEAYGVPAKQARRMDRFVQFAVAAGNMLMEHSGLVINDDNAGRVSVILGVGLGGLHTIEHTIAVLLRERIPGYIDCSPFGCRTGFHLLTWGEHSTEDVARALKESLEFIAYEATWDDVPATTIESCGNYRDHSLFTAKEWAKQILEEGISSDPFERRLV